MTEFEAIYGVFINEQDEVLLFQRTLERTFRSGEWDLMGGEIQKGETAEEAFRREALEKLKLSVSNYSAVDTPIRIQEQMGISTRYCFVSKDPIEEVVLDLKKYRGYEWVDKGGIMLPRIPDGIRKALTHVGYLD